MRTSPEPGVWGRSPRAIAPLLCALVAASGCGDAVARAIDDGPGSADGGVPHDGSLPTDGPLLLPDGAPLGDSPSFCAGNGPSIPLSGNECTGDLGGKLFRFAACSCSSAQVSGKLHTDSFDPTLDGGGAGGDYASLAANGSVSANGTVTLGGSIFAGGGAPALSLMGNGGTISRDTWSGGDVTSGGVYQIDGDLHSAGNVGIQSGSLSVVGKVHLSPGKTATGVTSGGGTVTENVVVVPPCDCGMPLDVASLVSPFKTTNDDAAMGITTAALHQPTAPVALSCGRYYFDDVAGGDVTLQLEGRTAIFVGGDLGVQGAMTIDLAPGAELDLFVAGNFSITGTATFGSPSNPSKVRVYVGGQTFDLSATVSVGANLYAPNANLAVASNFEMSGAIYAKSLAFSGDFTIHYDESIVATVGCLPPGGSCNTCNDCSGATPACKGGTCVACTTDSDCCAPLQCNQGRCVLRLR